MSEFSDRVFSLENQFGFRLSSDEMIHLESDFKITGRLPNDSLFRKLGQKRADAESERDNQTLKDKQAREQKEKEIRLAKRFPALKQLYAGY